MFSRIKNRILKTQQNSIDGIWNWEEGDVLTDKNGTNYSLIEIGSPYCKVRYGLDLFGEGEGRIMDIPLIDVLGMVNYSVARRREEKEKEKESLEIAPPNIGDVWKEYQRQKRLIQKETLELE